MSGARRSRPGRRGFTLVETVATIVVLAAIATVASAIMFTAADGYLDASTAAQLHTELSIAMDRAVRELRKIPLDDEASTIAPDIDRITDTSIAWNGDCDLAFSGGTLWLTIDGGEPAVLLADVDAFSVQACDESNLALAGPLVGATCNDVRRVALAVTLQRSGVSESLRAKVFIRSTMRGAEAGG